MQYLLRFILASYVVIFHVGSYYFPGAGSFAVFGFYTLSGFIITKVLNEVYYQKQNAARDFFINRVWRLYPTYFATTFIGLILAVIASDTAFYWSNSIQLPNASEWYWLIPNISIAGLHIGIPLISPIRYSPPSWTTAIEIYFYIFLFFWGAKSFFFAKIWLYISLLLTTCAVIITIYFSESAHPILSSIEAMVYQNIFSLSLCFALGAFCYFTTKKPSFVQNAYIGKLSFLVSIIIPLIYWRAIFDNEVVYMLFHYTESIAIAIFLIHAGDIPLHKFFRILGDMSYPIFLVHMQVAALLSFIGFNLIKSDATSIVIIYVGTLIVSLGLIYGIEYPLKGIRRKIRNRS